MRLTNRLGLPQAIVRALSNDEYDRGPANISVTGLTSPPRMVALRETYGAELEEDASDLIFALLGKAVHKVLEVADADNAATITEKRYYMRVPGPLGEWVISGQMDSIDLEALPDGSVEIADWKTAKVAEMVYGVKAEREQQLNVYKLLLEANGYKVGRLRDYFILRDWSKVQAAKAATPVATLTGSQQQDSSYPESQVVVHDVRIWSPQEAVQFVMERVAAHQQAQAAFTNALHTMDDMPGAVIDIESQGLLPDCTDDERWGREPSFAAVKTGAARASAVRATRAEVEQYITEHSAPFDTYRIEEGLARTGTTYKVFKNDGKRASKTFTDGAEAAAYVLEQQQTTEFEVQERPAESIRCEFYCSVAAVCDQWRQIREERAGG